MADRYDIAILGAGPAGEHAAYALVDAGWKVLLIERELIGGECSNWACIPTKTLLRPGEVRGDSERAAGTAAAALEWAELDRYRDYMTSAGDDSSRVKGYDEMGVTVVKGEGRLAGSGCVVVADDEYRAQRILISTGSEPVIPPIDGLEDAGYWTNREATALHEIPPSALVLGGGPVGVELAQFLRRFGSEVTVVQGDERLAPREDEHVSALLRDALEHDGITVHTGRHARGVRREGDARIVSLDDGGELRAEQLIVAVGRRPRASGIGLDTIGVELGSHGEVPVDEHCRVADGIWAAGDCTGAMLFTHVAKYQARVAMADMHGRPLPADLRAIPRVIFTDPEVAAVGLTEAQARDQGRDIVTASVQMSAVPRSYTYEQDPRGEMGVIVDRELEVMVGAWAVAPLASEWIHQAVLAIKAQVPLAVLRDTVPQFPSFSEAYLTALQSLEL